MFAIKEMFGCTGSTVCNTAPNLYFRVVVTNLSALNPHSLVVGNTIKQHEEGNDASVLTDYLVASWKQKTKGIVNSKIITIRVVVKFI
jgi:hypothetical protein